MPTRPEVPEDLVDTADTAHPAPDKKQVHRILDELFKAHYRHLCLFIERRIGSPDDARDLAQEAFAEAFRCWHCFRGESQARTWLFGIALNLTRNHLSRSPGRVYEFVDVDAANDVIHDAPEPCEIWGSREEMQVLMDELDQLPHGLSITLSLIAVDGLSYEEAARVLQVPIGTVRSRISRSRQLLRSRLALRGIDCGVDSSNSSNELTGRLKTTVTI